MKQQSFFDSRTQSQPLAARLRPETLEEFAGQRHLLGEGKILRQLIDQDLISSMIFWGPPGVGKTTLARIIARRTQAEFVDFSAVTSGIKEIKEVMAAAERSRLMGDRTILFVDEIHRFNKAQQDAFLPYVERGSITLIGATTENPSFEINSALLSRCKVFVLHPLQEEEIAELLHRALTDERGFGKLQVEMADELVRAVAAFANGDARTALGTLEMAVLNAERQGADGGHPGEPGAVHQQKIPPLRQGGRGALQPDLGPAQVDAQQRPLGGHLLAGADVGGRGGPPLRGPAAHPLRQ